MTHVILSQYKDIKKEIKHIEELIQRLESKMTSPRNSIITDMPTSPSYNPDKMGNDLIKLDELRDKYVEIKTKLYNQQIIAEDLIKDLEPIERDIIRYRYFDGLPWKEVNKRVGYAQRQTFRIHDGAIEKLQKK